MKKIGKKKGPCLMALVGVKLYVRYKLIKIEKETIFIDFIIVFVIPLEKFHD